MLKTILNKLENPNRPLMGPNIKALEFWGLLLPKNKIKKYIYYILHTSVVFFVITEYIDVWFVKCDFNLLLNNLKITMLATMSVVKVTTFLLWQKKWLSIIEYVTRADLSQRLTTDMVQLEKIETYKKYCRKITYGYWSLMYTTVLIVMFQPLIKYVSSVAYRDNVKNGTDVYMQVVSSWVPFDKNTLSGYIAASLFQTYASIYGGGWITSFDSNAIVIMVFFEAELKILREDCSKIFGTKFREISDELALRRLKVCYGRHNALVKYAQLFNSCLSPVMLLYMFICSVMLCVTAYQITIEPNPMQRFLMTEYLVFGVAQLFIYCWHSNNVLYENHKLTFGPYESVWWSRNISLQRDMNILIAQFNRTVVFSAGPFSKLTIPTFLSILKGAYSYYTLLSRSQLK